MFSPAKGVGAVMYAGVQITSSPPRNHIGTMYFVFMWFSFFIGGFCENN